MFLNMKKNIYKKKPDKFILIKLVLTKFLFALNAIWYNLYKFKYRIIEFSFEFLFEFVRFICII